MKRFIFILCFAALSCMTAGCSTIKKHPDFDRIAPRVQKISVVTPNMTVTKLVFKGDNETLKKESELSESYAKKAIELAFAKRGYEIVPFEIPESILKTNPEFPKELSKLKDKYLNQVTDVHKIKAKDFHLSVGSEINQFAELLGTDAFVFSDGTGYIKSKGEIAKDVAKTTLIAAATLGSVVVIHAVSGGEMNVAVVESDKGDILWNNFGGSSNELKLNMSNEKDVLRLTNLVLAKYPKRSLFKKSETVLVQDTVEVTVEPLSNAKTQVQIENQMVTTVTEKANVIAVRISQKTPREMACLVKLGADRIKSGDAEGAVDAFEEARRLDDKNASIHFLLGEAYFREGNLKKAEDHLNKSVKLDASLFAAQKLLSEVQAKLKEPKPVSEAVPVVKSAVVEKNSTIITTAKSVAVQ